MSNLISFSLANAATLAAAAAFLAGSFANASARKPIREEFVRYGFPWWWCWVTALLELMTAALLVLRPTFTAGVALGSCIMVAAIVAILRAGDVRHLLPPAAFLLLLLIAAFVQFS
ncbi:DoxX family protein [Rhizobium sp. 0TCS1.26]|uniref:DoxX family protein n=1 Tax=Rhizobium sp. 0TCS1.26 TaxID=3142623 RepID=UPI003D27DABB